MQLSFYHLGKNRCLLEIDPTDRKSLKFRIFNQSLNCKLHTKKPLPITRTIAPGAELLFFSRELNTNNNHDSIFTIKIKIILSKIS